MSADIISEFQKSFSDGWFGLKQGGELFPAQVASRTAAKEVLPVKYIANKSGSTLSKDVLWQTERDSLVRGYPTLGCVKIGPTVGYLKVRPQKQYKKGYVPSNVELFVPNYTQIRRSFPKFVATASSKEVVWQIFNREFFHPERAVQLMEEFEGVGYPLSYNFGLYCDSEHENLMILYKNRVIGVYKDKQFELFKGFALLKEQFERETKVTCNVGA